VTGVLGEIRPHPTARLLAGMLLDLLRRFGNQSAFVVFAEHVLSLRVGSTMADELITPAHNPLGDLRALFKQHRVDVMRGRKSELIQ
jgi:hypothetical protein